MDGSTRITYERVQEDAKIIDNCRKRMEEIFTDVNHTMALATDPNTTEGKVALALKDSFNKLSGSFHSYTSKVEQLYQLILANAEATQAMEQKQEAAASNLTH